MSISSKIPSLLQQRHDLAPQAAVELWSKTTTAKTSLKRMDLIRDKQKAVSGFFNFIKKLPDEVSARDVDSWRAELGRYRIIADGVPRTFFTAELKFLEPEGGV